MKPLNLIAHPEGGRFQEVYRSFGQITTENGKKRSALTHIYFSLADGEASRFHKVVSDEVWNLYQGEGLCLYTWSGKGSSIVKTTLSASTNCFCSVVPGGVWQAAEPLSGPVLVGCSVAPGFEFTDFTLIDQKSTEAKTLLEIDPDLARFIITQESG